MHLAFLAGRGTKHDEKGLVPAKMFGYQYGLQAAIEKRSAEPMDIYPLAQDPRDDMRSLVRTLVKTVVRIRSALYVIFGELTAFSADYAWFGPKESDIPQCSKDRAIGAPRQTETLEWRRAYLLFAARTLAGSTRYGRGLVTAAAQAQDRSVLYVICSGPHALSVDYAWLGLRESDIPRYPKCSMGDAIRQTEVLEWRRTCLLFAARTMAGSNRYGQAIAPDPSAERPWRELWFDGLRQGARDHWGDGFEQLMAMWGNQLDEPARPVHGFGIGSNHRRTRPTHKWIQSWLSRYVLDTWQ